MISCSRFRRTSLPVSFEDTPQNGIALPSEPRISPGRLDKIVLACDAKYLFWRALHCLTVLCTTSTLRPSSLADGNAVLTPLFGARVHINGIVVSAGAETLVSHNGEGRSEVSSPGLRQNHDHRGGVLRQDYRVLFGSRHFFRVECNKGLPSAPGTVGHSNGMRFVARKCSLSFLNRHRVGESLTRGAETWALPTENEICPRAAWEDNCLEIRVLILVLEQGFHAWRGVLLTSSTQLV